MPPRNTADPAKTRAAVLATEAWLRDDTAPAPERAVLAEAVRLTARSLAAVAPGIRGGSGAAVRRGAVHHRTPAHAGTPPNVVETDPRTWLLLATGLLAMDDAAAAGRVDLSGSRAGEVASWLPLIGLGS